MKSMNPYLNFNGNCEEAFNFYQNVFGGKLQIVRYKDMNDQMGLSGDALNKVANVALPLGSNTVLYGSDTPDTESFGVKSGNQFHINIQAQSEEEAEKLFNALSEGGNIKVPVSGSEEFAEKFGMCTDKFTVNWMVMYKGNKDV